MSSSSRAMSRQSVSPASIRAIGVMSARNLPPTETRSVRLLDGLRLHRPGPVIQSEGDEPEKALLHASVRAYLEFGVLAHGFLRARCGACGHDRIIAFSCEGHGSLCAYPQPRNQN